MSNVPPSHPPSLDDLRPGERQRLAHVLLWYYAKRRDMTLKPHHTRDGSALFELLAILTSRGYGIGEQCWNFPPSDPEDATIIPAEIPNLEAGDLVLIGTRLPLDDSAHGDRIKIERGFATPEEIVFAIARRYFAVLARSHVRLTDALAARLPADRTTRADLWVRVLKAAWYRECKSLDGRQLQRFREGEHRTPAFVIRLNGVEALNGADLLIAFAMGGTETLIWARRLRTDFSHLLWRPGFTFVEMIPPEESGRPDRPTNVSFAHKWTIEEVLHVADVPA
jgi:hypothetical protein